ncbi:MAG TPA: hypothetical protein VH853_13375 [Polyangia bacterium]|nr:hypothetical protein [Polyangia bacterium]
MNRPLSVWRALAESLAARRGLLLLLAVAAAPFVPGALQVLRHGVPEVLFTGDGAVLEIRTLHAAHGRQLLGPYSRFLWSHPGPAFFYLALPVYQLFHQRGPALNLFVLLANFAAATALVLTARRLRGDLFAFVVAVLLAVYETVGAPFPLSGEWNPMTPVLPLALLLFLSARLGRGELGPLPAIAFVASAIVQTHIGFSPSVLYLVATGALFCLRELYLVRPTAARAGAMFDRRRAAISLLAAAGLLALLWAPPLYENLSRPDGNLHTLRLFFLAPHASEHSWRVAMEAVSGQLAIFPLALCRLLGRATMSVGATGRHLLAIGQLLALAIGLAVALARRDEAAALLVAMALGSIVVATSSVRAIRGEIFGYLVAWISVLGFGAWAALAAAFWPATFRGRRTAIGLLALGLPLLALALRAGGDKPLTREHDRPLEQLVAEVETFAREARLDHPRVEILAHDQWPQAAALILSLYKHHLGVSVPNEWLFMFGTELASDGGAHPALIVADDVTAAGLRARPDCRLIASAEGTSVFFRPAGVPSAAGLQ